jgi:hypothetical protein
VRGSCPFLTLLVNSPERILHEFARIEKIEGYEY